MIRRMVYSMVGAVTSLALISLSYATIVVVPDDEATISEGIDVVSSGDTVQVKMFPVRINRTDLQV
jgi:hypothetical protein